VTSAYLWEWLNLLGRSLHVIAGIAWIGASFYFIWLDNHLQPAADPAASDRGVGGELWAVHGGGFYHSQKYRGAPPALPTTLHWFKWEAYTTLLSGLFLLAVVYYAQAATMLVDPAMNSFGPAGAIAASLAWIVGGWLVYEALCRSPLGHSTRALALVLAILTALAAFGLCHVFPGRAAFLHFGAMLGTIMVLNVFVVIIPGQKALVAAAAAGQPVDPKYGLQGKQRSVHNTYFTLPAVFAMISNHYAWIFGAPNNWVWLILISAAGAFIRVWFVLRHRGKPPAWPLINAAILLAVTAYGVRPQSAASTITWTTGSVPEGRITSRPLPSSSPSASAITALTPASSSGLPPLNRTFLSNCGSGSKRWSNSLAGIPERTSSARICSAATSPSPVVA